MRKAITIFCVIIFLTGLGILLYPFISNMINQQNATQVIDDYEDEIQNMDKEDIDVIKEAAKKYNEQLSNAISVDEDVSSYSDITALDQVIGYIVIPKIDVNLPIFSGTSEEVLAKGIGHMTQTSYPLGGASTHCVLTGHRGLPSATLFTDLDKLDIGDVFYLHVLDEILAYQIDKVKVVEPDDSSFLEIEEGKDYCTLVTCTPYGINSHRLLVRGTRVEYVEGAESEQGGTQMQSGSFAKRILDVWPWLLIAFVIIAGGETAIFVMIMRRRRKKEED